MLFPYLACEVGSSGEPLNQGTLQQTPEGQIVAYLTNRGIGTDPRFNQTSMIALYLYKKADYSLNCATASDRLRCEDDLIFKKEKVDALGFTNEPGYFGYDAAFGSYYPNLISDPVQNFPSVKPADPPGFADPDVWQCVRIPFTNSPNYNKYECGVNWHPIRYFRRDLTTYTMQAYATNGRGFASSYILDYNLFNSLNHPVRDGDRYFAYFAVHFNAMKPAADSEDRFDASATTWKRPIEPELVSPRIEVRIKLLAEGPYDKPGSVYDIPDFSTWYDPFASCRPTAGTAPGSVYFSEILWMGSEDTGGTASTEDEFIELYNATSSDINVSQWRIEGAGTGGQAVILPLCTVIKANSVLTIGKHTNKAFTEFNVINSSLSLLNSGRNLTLKDASGTTIHTLSGCTSNWGGKGLNGGSGLPKSSMRLNPLVRTVPFSASACNTTDWVTSQTSDAGYATASANLNPAYLAGSDTTDGTVATPGFAGP